MSAASELPEKLEALLGPAGVVTDRRDLEVVETDWRRAFPGRALCLIRPSSAVEIAAVVQLCRQHGAALVPQGGHTGLAGGATPDASGSQIVMSFSRLAQVRNIDPIGMTMEAEAGCVLKVAQDAANAAGRLLPVSFAAEGSATIGGIVASNAGGVNVLRYGMTRALVLGLEVVLADGTILSGLRRLRKDNAGYDWKQLFIGSEGTLGIVTAAVLRLAAKPAHSVTALLAVPDPRAALSLLELAQDALGDQISAFEMMSAASLALVAKHGGKALPIAGDKWFVLIEAASSLAGLGIAMEAMLAAAFEKAVASDGLIAQSGKQAAQLWTLREHIPEAELREGRSIKHDVSVPLGAIPAFLDEACAALARAAPGAKVNAFGHVGDGNIHFNVLAGVAHEAAKINRIIHDVVAHHDGSISAEHGIGQYRIDELARYRTQAELDLARRIKRALDPEGQLNPGKVVRP